MPSILIVGAGPVGLTLASELARHGVRCRIVDRLAEPLPYCRAIGVTPRTLEVWDDMGIAREMIDAGLWLTGLRSIIAGHPPTDLLLDFTDLPYAPLGLPQYETERILTRHLERQGVTVERGTTLETLSQDEQQVSVRLLPATGVAETATFSYVVGCDGAHSAVRHTLGIGFPGDAFPMTFMLGDVHIASDLPRGMALRALRPVQDSAPDMFIAVPLPEPGRYRVSTLAPLSLADTGGSQHGIQTERPGPDLAQLQAVADDMLPNAPRLSDLRWSSLFRISMRLAERYREGRVFLAGDAAHIHPPTGGQGMNTGIQDAYNLAWKLALVMNGRAPETLLDSYEAERRPVGADVVARTREASQSLGHERGKPPDRLADTQILVSYRGTPWVRDDHPQTDEASAGGIWAGDRIPDVDGLRRSGVGSPLRLHDILRGTEHVLIARLDASPVEIAEFAAAVRALNAHRPVRGVVITETGMPDHYGVSVYWDAAASYARTLRVTATDCVLARPDGYVGWRGTSWHSPGLGSYFDFRHPI